MNKSVYSYNCVISLESCVHQPSISLLLCVWYVDTSQPWGACFLNGPIWCNVRTWGGFIKLLVLVFGMVMVNRQTFLQQICFVFLWHTGPFLFIFLDVLKFQTKVCKCFSSCCSEILVFSSQRDYPLRSYANPYPTVRVMLNPWNNSVAERLWITSVVFCQAAPHCHEILVVSSVRSVWGCFWRSCSGVGSVRGLERTCVMCVKGCPVEWEPVSSVSAPYLSHPSPFTGLVTLFLFLQLYLSHVCVCKMLNFVLTHRWSK